MTAAAVFAVARVDHKSAPVRALEFKPWPELTAELTAHHIGPKDGPGWLPARIEPGARIGGRVAELSALVLDVEARCEALADGTKRVTGPLPPTLQALAAELELRGIAAVLATSHSNEAPAADGGTVGPRYRVTIAPSRPIAPDEVRPLGLHVARLLGIGDALDAKCLEPSRLYYLPRCPAERHHLAASAVVQGQSLDVDAMLQAARAAERPPQQQRGGQASASLIDAFNAAHDVGAILEQHGYMAAGPARWIWPQSTTGEPGVVRLPESGRIYSHHGADPLAGEHSHDAFSAWCVLAHKGDVRAAVREAARTLAKLGPSQRGKPAESSASAGDSQASNGTPAPFDRAEAIRRARELLSPSMRDREAPTYPFEALGPLADACDAIATAGQVQPAMVGQCLLGAASLLTQGMFNVETLAGSRPLALFLLTLGDSGDGKSTAQGAALQPVHEWQRRAGADYAAALREHDQTRATRKKGDELPDRPATPFRLVSDATVEGLRRDLDTGPCAQGMFTDEAAAVLSGWGMTPENRSKTAGVLSKLWDAGHLSASRATGGRVERYGRRLAMHWLIQPMAASEAIGDPLLAALGFWPRFLAAWPAPQAPRLARPFRPAELPAVADYWQRCAELLAEPLADDAGDCPMLPLTDDARELLGQAFERFERDARCGALRSVKPWGLRASEQVCRVAGVLAAFEGRPRVEAAAARDALALVAYSLQTWRAIVDEGAADASGSHALRLFEWLTGRPSACERLASIVKDGPAATRTKDKRDAALALLREHGLADVSDGTAQALMPAEPAQ